MTTDDARVANLMKYYAQSQDVALAAAKVGVSENTARKYIKAGKLPSQIKKEQGPRVHRTRKNPFVEVWDEVVDLLTCMPNLQVKTVFEDLCRKYPNKNFKPGQLRTLQRQVKNWRASEGPHKPAFFPQEHKPGEALQTDFTSMNALQITIGGEIFHHLLCHATLPFSNWEWVTVCQSESIVALKTGFQGAVFQLQALPEFHQTDNSTAATHRNAEGKREFNREYLEVMDHFEVKPRTTGIGKKEQNGDVEALNGALKRRIEQQLLLRGSRDFESREDYQSWLQELCRQVNLTRQERLQVELKAMRPLKKSLLPSIQVRQVKVNKFSHIRLKGVCYSVPTRLTGATLRAEIGETEIVLKLGGRRVLTLPRSRGGQKHQIRYEHLIESMLGKPGSFRCYKYQSAFFPNLKFREAYDRLCDNQDEYRASSTYLNILHSTLRYGVEEVSVALDLLASGEELPSLSCVEALCGPVNAELPELSLDPVCLEDYDHYLEWLEGEVA